MKTIKNLITMINENQGAASQSIEKHSIKHDKTQKNSQIESNLTKCKLQGNGVSSKSTVIIPRCHTTNDEM